MSDKIYLILENGKVFEGRSFGARGEITGEIVFTTGMTGYIETLTDQSYLGQIVVQTFPLMGNYGIIPSDFESNSVTAAAYIVKHWCQEPSNFRSEGELDTFLKRHNVVGMHGIDTRALTKIIRDNGVMNGKITSEPDNTALDEIRSFAIRRPVKSVTVSGTEVYKSEKGRLKVALLDYGLKKSMIQELLERDCHVHVFPAYSTVQDVLSIHPDGILLSNGPGDPMDNPGIIAMLSELKKLRIPIFGIGLGHQLMAMANGFSRTKLKYGHRGANQPIKELESGKVYITSQNHGYAILSESIDPKIAQESFINVNDGTCEGIEYLNYPIFTVQFYPETFSGSNNTRLLFDKFMSMMEEGKNASK